MGKALAMIERVRKGEDAGDVIAGKEIKKEEGKEKDGEGESLRERAERFLGTRGDKRS